MLAPLLPLLLATASPAAARCPGVERPAPFLTYAALRAAESALDDALADAAPACAPALDLVQGEIRLATGRPREAQAPLTRAVVAGGPERARALGALGRALALDGQPFEALRTLALAERAARGDEEERTQALDAATLLARLHVRRGGTAWGAYHLEPVRSLGKEIDAPRAIASSGSRWAVLGKRALLVDPELPREAFPRLPEDSRPVAIAASPRGDLAVLLGDGTLLRAGDRAKDAAVTRSGVRLLLATGRPVSGDGLALGPRDQAFVLADGKVHVFAADGKLESTLGLDHVAAIASDGAGRLHVLFEGDRGLSVLAPDGTPLFKVAASGPSHRWTEAVAVASDPLGGTYVLARAPALVWMFDASGAFAGRLEAPESDPRVLASARAIAAGAAGEVFVLSAGSDTVSVFR